MRRPGGQSPFAKFALRYPVAASLFTALTVALWAGFIFGDPNASLLGGAAALVISWLLWRRPDGPLRRREEERYPPGS